MGLVGLPTEATAPKPFHSNLLELVFIEKGVVTDSERYIKDGEYIAYFVTEYSNFININGIWGFQTMTETSYDSEGKQLYEITSSYSNIQLNTGIPDSAF